MRISDWSSDVCSSDLQLPLAPPTPVPPERVLARSFPARRASAGTAPRQTSSFPRSRGSSPRCHPAHGSYREGCIWSTRQTTVRASSPPPPALQGAASYCAAVRSEEHTSELQSLMRISYAVFCLKKKKTRYNNNITHDS